MLTQLEQWWSDPASPDRVVALVAIGGAGKTAVAERTLRHIAARPNGGGVFVWSFYEAPSSGDFLCEACRYFAGEPGQDIGGRLWALKTALRGGEPHLVVFDGLERVQSEGGAGRARGALEDAPLRQLMQALAAGLGRTRALVTSRFPLVDLESWKGGGLAEIRLDDLDPDSGRALLRAWGVHGPDAALDAIAARVGGHALSMSVLGSYIANFGGGNPAMADQLDLDEAGRLDAKANKLLRLLTAYAEALPEGERQVMARLALFPRGVEAEVLADLVRDGVVAGVLLGWDQIRVAASLTRLVSRGLAFAYRRGSIQLFTAHPFVREGFAALLDVPAAEVHRTMAERLGAGLDDRPGTRPTDSASLDRFEAMIAHLVGAGQVKRAFQLYKDFGGYSHLGKHLGDYVRAARILTLFPDPDAPSRTEHALLLDDRISLLIQQGLVYGNLDLASSNQAYNAAERIVNTSESELSTVIDNRYQIKDNSNDTPDDDTAVDELWTSYARIPKLFSESKDPAGAAELIRSLLAQNELHDERTRLAFNQSELALLRGRLHMAVFAAETALAFVRRAGPQRYLMVSLCSLAYAQALTGSLATARLLFEETKTLVDYSPTSIRELYEAEVRARLGERVQARVQAEALHAKFSRVGNQRNAVRCHTLLGRIALPGDAVVAGRHLAPAREWATRTGDLEVILQVHQLAAALHHTTGDLDATLAELNEGIRVADDHGVGLFSIDLRIDRARVRLDQNDHVAAQRDARDALERSVDPECSYAWGEADAAHVLGEAHLARHDQINAQRYFERALEVRTRIEHPDARATHARLAALRA